MNIRTRTGHPAKVQLTALERRRLSDAYDVLATAAKVLPEKPVFEQAARLLSDSIDVLTADEAPAASKKG